MAPVRHLHPRLGPGGTRPTPGGRGDRFLLRGAAQSPKLGDTPHGARPAATGFFREIGRDQRPQPLGGIPVGRGGVMREPLLPVRGRGPNRPLLGAMVITQAGVRVEDAIFEDEISAAFCKKRRGSLAPSLLSRAR